MESKINFKPVYQEHSSFKPITDDSKIWRFMDFAKFCAVLEKGTLFFSMPKSFEDPWEGCIPKKNFEHPSFTNFSPEMQRKVKSTQIYARENFAVNCWHISDDESEAFWKKYSNRGVAVQTTFGKLKESFKNTEDWIYIGKIEYKDQNVDIIDPNNLYNYILWKRRSFEHEKELRAVVGFVKKSRTGIIRLESIKGKEIPVDLNILIENIYTTPFEKDTWFNDLATDVIKRYGFKFPCIKSTLMDLPLI